MPPETAAPDPVAVVQAWHAALNNGDLDGALALMTEDATISGWRPPVRGVLDWWIDIKTHFGVQDCQQDGEQLACDVIMTDDASYRIWDDEATGADQMRSMFDWLAGKETQYQIADCVWDGFGVACSMSVVDGCIAAFGAPDGLPGTMSFYPLEDGTLRRVVGLLDLSGRQSYGDWLEAEAA
jgi:hypothetical protein